MNRNSFSGLLHLMGQNLDEIKKKTFVSVRERFKPDLLKSPK